MIYRDKQVVADASRYLAQTAMTLNPVAICNPINLTDLAEDWKKAALAGYFPCPKFRYDHIELGRAAIMGQRVQNYWNKIRYNCTPQNDLDRAILRILENRVCDALLTSDIASNICREYDQATQEAILGIYGQPEGSFVARCYDALEHPATYYRRVQPRFDSETVAKLKQKRFKATDIRNAFNKVLNYYGFIPDWECILDPKVKTIDARDKTEDGHSRLVVPSKRTSDGYSMATLIGHEIESHIRGSQNSRFLMRKLLQLSPLEPLINLLAKSDDERFYEGVAKTSDVAISGNDAMPHPYYTIAINLALTEHKNFGEVANVIFLLHNTGFSTREAAANSAWNITRRIFRGATNTSLGFAFTKDYGYLYGYEAAESAPASYYDYSSMTLDELRLLENAGVDLSNPRYPKKDAIKDILGA